MDAKSGELSARLAHEQSKLESHGAGMAAADAEHDAAGKEAAELQKELDAATAHFKEFELRDTKVRSDA